MAALDGAGKSRWEWTVGLPGAFLSEDIGCAQWSLGPLDFSCVVGSGGCHMLSRLANLPPSTSPTAPCSQGASLFQRGQSGEPAAPGHAELWHCP